MKTIALLLLALLVVGCSMADSQSGWERAVENESELGTVSAATAAARTNAANAGATRRPPLPSASSFESTRDAGSAGEATPATVHDLDEPYGGWETNDGYAFVLDEDGTAIVMNPDGTTGIGVWTIDGNTLCLIGGGEEVCETYRQDGDTMTFGSLTFYRR